MMFISVVILTMTFISVMVMTHDYDVFQRDGLMVITKKFISVMIMPTIRPIGNDRVFTNRQEKLGASSRKTLSVELCSPTITGY